MSARNVYAIAEIPKLYSLSIGIFDLQDFRVLESVSPDLEKLSIGATRSKKPSLAPLNRFRALQTLYIEGHSNDIEVIGGLQDLKVLTLRSITTPNLVYLEALEQLGSLEIKLGGIRSFEGIQHKTCIKYLELWQIRELHSIDIISTLPGLQYSKFQSLPHIGALPTLQASKHLRRILIDNLKGLTDFSALEDAPALQEFALVDGRFQSPEQLLPVLRNPVVKNVRCGFGSTRKNSAFDKLRTQYGKEDFKGWTPFQFQ